MSIVRVTKSDSIWSESIWNNFPEKIFAKIKTIPISFLASTNTFAKIQNWKITLGWMPLYQLYKLDLSCKKIKFGKWRIRWGKEISTKKYKNTGVRRIFGQNFTRHNICSSSNHTPKLGNWQQWTLPILAPVNHKFLNEAKTLSIAHTMITDNPWVYWGEP